MNRFVALTGIAAEVTVDMLANVTVIVLDVKAIDLEFALPPPYAVDLLADAWDDEAVGNIDVSVKMLIDVLVADEMAVTIFGVVSDFSIVVLGKDAGKDVNVLSAAMTALEFTISPSLEATLSFCCAALTCWPMADLGCDRVLQAWMPSYHV